MHVGGGEDEFLRSVEQAHDGLADQPFLLLGQQSVADPTRAPEGKHTAWAYTHGPQQGVDWAPATPHVAERMEAQVERFAPGFRDRILARHVLGPADLEAPQREPRRRRRRRRQLPAAPGRLPPGPEALALQHAAEGPVHRQRRDVPGRRRPRRAGRRRRPRRAQVVDEAVLERVAHELGAGGAAQLLLDVRAVGLDRARGEEELLADLDVGVAERDQPQDVDLARRQVVRRAVGLAAARRRSSPRGAG